VLKVGDANPEDLAKQLFGRPKAVTSNISLREITNGFGIEYARISMRAVTLVMVGTYSATGILFWIFKREDFAEVMAMAWMPALMISGLLYAFGKAISEMPPLMQFDSLSGKFTIDASETFQLDQLESIYDIRGDFKGCNGGYRQVSALVRQPDGLFLYRLFHQCDDGRIKDNFVIKLSKRLGVHCCVIDKVKFPKSD
jgi:hypothetical protein